MPPTEGCRLPQFWGAPGVGARWADPSRTRTGHRRACVPQTAPGVHCVHTPTHHAARAPRARRARNWFRPPPAMPPASPGFPRQTSRRVKATTRVQGPALAGGEIRIAIIRSPSDPKPQLIRLWRQFGCASKCASDPGLCGSV